jgi:hypothetical protein
MLVQSGYQATILAHRGDENATQPSSNLQVPTTSFSNASQVSAFAGDVLLDLQNSNSNFDTASSAPLSNPPNKTSQGVRIGTNLGIDTRKGSSEPGLSQDLLAVDPYTMRNMLRDHPCKLKDQWLLLCFYHNNLVSRAVHMTVGEESCDVKLIRSFREEYVTNRGMIP